MKKYVFFIIIGISFFLHVKSQTFQWAFQGGGEDGSDFGQGITTDNKGNVLIVADYMGNANYGGTFLTGIYFSNCLVSTHDSIGNLLWVNKVNGANSKGISADMQGNSYITGSCGNAVFYGNGNSIAVTSTGNGDAFIAKYDAAGNILWVKLYGFSFSNDISNAIKTDAEGNSYIAGTNYGTVEDAPANFFIIKYDTQGNLLWLKNSNWGVHFYPNNLDIDEEGNCYITGSFGETLNLDGLILTSAGSSNCMIKLDGNGNVAWAKKDGTNHYGKGIALDKKGNFFVTGNYETPSNFGSTTLTGGAGGAFIAKYDTSGNTIWAKACAIKTQGIGVASDTVGNCFITGLMHDPVVFGEGADTVTLISAKSQGSMFLAKYGPDGNLLWAISPAGSNWGSNPVMAIHADEKNNCYITGGFCDTSFFGDFLLYSTRSQYGTNFDIFIAKLFDSTGIVNLTGIKKNEKNSFFSIFPNPTNSAITISYKCTETINNLQVEIINTAGQIIYSNCYNGYGNELRDEINLYGLPKGIFFIEILAGEKREVRKIVLQ